MTASRLKKTKVISAFVLILVVVILGVFISRIVRLIIISPQSQDNQFQKEGVEIIFDKELYYLDEKIKITIKNNYNKSIFIPGAFIVSQIQKKDGDGWIILDSYCRYPYCFYKLPGPQEIKAGESKEIEWFPVYYIENDYASLNAGEYTISVEYGYDLESEKGGDWRTVYSKVFTIL